MRNTVFTLALGSLLALGAAVTHAQDAAPPQDQTQQQQAPMRHGRHRMDPGRQLRHLTRQLDLTADQQNQIRPLLTDQQQQMQTLWQDQSLSRDDRRSKAMQIQQDTHSKIEAVLNDQQKQKFEAMQQRMREHRRGMQGGNPPAPSSPPAGSPQPQ